MTAGIGNQWKPSSHHDQASIIKGAVFIGDVSVDIRQNGFGTGDSALDRLVGKRLLGSRLRRMGKTSTVEVTYPVSVIPGQGCLAFDQFDECGW